VGCLIPPFPYFTSLNGAPALELVLLPWDWYFSIPISIPLYFNVYSIPPLLAQHQYNGCSSTVTNTPLLGFMLLPPSQCFPVSIGFHHENFWFHIPNTFDPLLWELMLPCYDVHSSAGIDTPPLGKTLLNSYRHCLIRICTSSIGFRTISLPSELVLCTKYSLSGCCICLVVHSLFTLIYHTDFLSVFCFTANYYLIVPVLNITNWANWPGNLTTPFPQAPMISKYP